MGHEGIDIRQAGDRLIFRSFLLNTTQDTVLSVGTVTLKLFELQSDGTLKQYDFNDNTFKTATFTTKTANFTHRAVDSVNTGLWTYLLTTLTGFTPGRIYFALVECATGAPALQCREFQFGGKARLGPHSKSKYTLATGVMEWYEDDGTTKLATLTPSEAAGVRTLASS